MRKIFLGLCVFILATATAAAQEVQVPALGQLTGQVSAAGTGSQHAQVLNATTNVQNGFHIHGDSVACGAGSTPTSQGWDQLVAAEVLKNTSALTEYCVPGYYAADANNTIFVNESPADSGNAVIALSVGRNDAPSNLGATYQVVYNQIQKASLARASLSSTNTVAGSAAAVSTTGTWSNDTTYSSLTGIQSTTNGSTASTSIIASNGLIYLYYGDFISSGGTFSVTIDGVAATDTITGNTGLTSQPATSFQTNGPTRVVALARFVVTPGVSHTVVVTVTSATSGSNPVSILGFAVPPATRGGGITGNKVFFAGIIYDQNDASPTTSGTTNALNANIASAMAADGLAVYFVDVRKYINATLDMSGVAEQNCPASSIPGLHPNNCGHRHLANAFEDAINPIGSTIAPSLFAQPLNLSGLAAPTNMVTGVNGGGGGTPFQGNALVPSTLCFSIYSGYCWGITFAQDSTSTFDTIITANNNAGKIAFSFLPTNASFSQLKSGIAVWFRYDGAAQLGPSTTISTAGVLSSPTLASSVATGTAPLAVTSTTPVANLTVSNHPTVSSCGTTSTCANTAETGSRIIFGTAVLVSGSPSTVTVSGITAFTSSTSFVCPANDQTSASALKVVNVSSSSFTIIGPNGVTDTVGYMCVGY